MILFGTVCFVLIILQGCVSVKTSAIDRSILISSSSFEVVGSIRLEEPILIYNMNYLKNLHAPYDKLLKMAHEKYGEVTDVIEIKTEYQFLSVDERNQLRKDTKKNYTINAVHNALVVKYFNANK